MTGEILFLLSLGWTRKQSCSRITRQILQKLVLDFLESEVVCAQLFYWIQWNSSTIIHSWLGHLIPRHWGFFSFFHTISSQFSYSASHFKCKTAGGSCNTGWFWELLECLMLKTAHFAGETAAASRAGWDISQNCTLKCGRKEGFFPSHSWTQPLLKMMELHPPVPFNGTTAPV